MQRNRKLNVFPNPIENIKYFLEEYGEDSSVHCQKIIENVAERINKILQGKEINLKLNRQKSITVSMDVNILTTIFTGLLKNAIEKTPDKGLIEVCTMKEEDPVHLQVKDHGVGITNNSQKNIFTEAAVVFLSLSFSWKRTWRLIFSLKGYR